MFVRVIRFVLTAWLLVGAICITASALAQSPDAFMAQAVPLAQQSQRETSVPASVTLAQAIWETGRGASSIGEANNFFGIKAALMADDNVNVGPIASGWIWALTKEWDGKRFVTSRERFRKYRSIEDSFRDHGILLATTPRYAEAMRVVDDPREFARRIAAAGYATLPTYGDDLIRLMDQENLYRYDLPRNDAQFLGQSEYPTVNPGEIFQIYFDVKNTGFGTWSPTAGYYLGSINDQRFSANERQPLDQLVLPERVKRWTITMVAPLKPGDYRTAWQLKHGGSKFGPEMYNDVHVREPSSASLGQITLGIIVGAGIILGGGLFLFHRNRKKPFEIPLNPR